MSPLAEEEAFLLSHKIFINDGPKLKSLNALRNKWQQHNKQGNALLLEALKRSFGIPLLQGGPTLDFLNDKSLGGARDFKGYSRALEL